MAVSVKVKRDIGDVLKWLAKSFSTHEGRIAWPGELNEQSFQLVASITFTPRIEDHEKDDAIWRTINDCARLNNFEQNVFARKLRENIAKLLSRAEKSYIVTAQINVPNYLEFPPAVSSVYGPVSLSRHLSRSEQRLQSKKRPFETQKIQIENDFLFLRYKLKARSARSALQTGNRNLQCCVGILNLVTRGFGLSMRIGIPDAPLGGLMLASTTLLVDPALRTVGDWMILSQYPHLFKGSFTANSVNLPEIVPYTRLWVRQIKRTDFSDRLSNAITLFQEGLSATSIDVALIKLWTCIELLCARPSSKEPLDRVIERAAGIFYPPQVTKMRLEFIANSRHAVVHRGESGEHSLLCAQWASIYAADVIGFFAFNIHGLTKHSEILDYLSAPQSTDRLKDVIRIHSLRLKGIKANSEPST
jgi:hypothetical protein